MDASSRSRSSYAWPRTRAIASASKRVATPTVTLVERSGHERLEAVDVSAQQVGTQAIAAGRGLDRRRGRAEGAPEPGYLAVDRGLDIPRERLAPDGIRDPVDADQPIAVKGQDRQEAPSPGAANADDAACDDELHRSKHPDL